MTTPDEAAVNIGPTTDQRNHACPDCGAFWTTHPERTPFGDKVSRIARAAQSLTAP